MRHASILIAMLVTAPLIADAKPKAKAKAKGKPPKAQINRTAKAHTNRAAKAHKAGKFDVALTELEAAYAIDPDPKLLFAIAQVQAKLDRCDGAIDNYEKFLATTKDKQKQTVVKQAIASCKTKQTTVAAAPPAAEPAPPKDDAAVFRDKPAEAEPPPPQTQTPPEPRASEPLNIVDDAPPGVPASSPPAETTTTTTTTTPGGRSPWYKDVLGDVLVVGGVAAGAVSILMYSSARGDLDAAEGAGSIDEYERLVDRAHDRRTYAVVLAGGSAVLIGAGLLRYALRGSGESRPAVTVAPLHQGGLVTWSGGF